jgi:ABC-2 type transport system ATP-binding protein
MNDALLQVTAAARSYGGQRGLDGVTLSLRGGEIYALLGPNGAGKTSLVRAICGRVRLDSGTVRVQGADPRLDPSLRRRLGLVPQEIALYPDLTVRENLEVLGRLAGLARGEVEDAATRALAWTGLGDRASSRVATLSGGMRRRVNLAAGALHRPDVLLLDEPTAGVDPQARERIHDLLRGLRGQGMAILLATHDLDQAAELADRIGILVEGRLRAEGTLADLVEASFGSSRELSLHLAAAPDDDAVRLLRSEGLTSASDPRFWSGPLAGGYASVAALGQRLSDARVPLAELRLREPGLRGVFFRVAGREIEE